MGRCYRCGSQFPGGIAHSSTCPTCAQVEEAGLLREETVSLREGIEESQAEVVASLERLTAVQQQGFEKLSHSLAEVSSIIEWGFAEINWELQQQTEILRSIDHTLRTPSQTQANEHRIMAEELRKRGAFDKSIGLFSQALLLFLWTTAYTLVKRSPIWTYNVRGHVKAAREGQVKSGQ